MRFVLCCVVLLAVSMIASGGPRIDGQFEDWGGVALLATDPAGDNTDTADVTFVQAQSRGTDLFLMMDLNAELNVQSGATNTEIPLVHIELPTRDVLTVNMRTRTNFLNNVGNPVGLDVTKLTTGPTYAGERVELRVALGGLGVHLGNTVRIALSGTDELAEPVAFTLDTPAEKVERRSAERMENTAFRIAAYNTEQNGIQAIDRREKIYRHIRAARADVYCFEEEWNLSSAAIATAMGQANPHGDDATWNVRKIGGTHIASRSNLIPMPSFNGRYSAAIVELPAGAVCVLAIHPKCCGSIGSGEDAQRINQTRDMIRTIDGLRSADHGEAYVDIPVVIVGDWNLVGSRTPLTMLENAEGHGLREWILPQLIGNESFTWLGRGTGPGSFTPGRLDLCAYSADRLVRRNGFVLDSRTLDAAELKALGLEAGDSAASDHMMLVADFAFNDGVPTSCAGDIDADFRVGVPDLSLAIAHLGLSGGRADVNADGAVNVNDLSFVIFRLGDVCE